MGARLVNVSEPVFFGWSQRYPQVKLRPTYRPWHTDKGGPLLGSDYWYCGAECSVTVDMTVWNENCYAMMQSYAGANYRGQDLQGDVGRWMAAEGAVFQLYVIFPYNSGIYLQMPPGLHFFGTFLDDDASFNGSTARKLRLTWRCIRMFNPLDQSYSLYDTNIAPCGAVPATITPRS